MTAPLTAHDRLLHQNFGIAELANSEIGAHRRVSGEEVVYARVTLFFAAAFRVVAVVAVVVALAATFWIRRDNRAKWAAARVEAMHGRVDCPSTVHLGKDLFVIADGNVFSLVEGGRVTAVAVDAAPRRHTE